MKYLSVNFILIFLDVNVETVTNEVHKTNLEKSRKGKKNSIRDYYK